MSRAEIEKVAINEKMKPECGFANLPALDLRRT
jgi:hypothetical protein